MVRMPYSEPLLLQDKIYFNFSYLFIKNEDETNGSWHDHNSQCIKETELKEFMLISLNLLLCLTFRRFLNKDGLTISNMASALFCVSLLITSILFYL